MRQATASDVKFLCMLLLWFYKAVFRCIEDQTSHNNPLLCSVCFPTLVSKAGVMGAIQKLATRTNHVLVVTVKRSHVITRRAKWTGWNVWTLLIFSSDASWSTFVSKREPRALLPCMANSVTACHATHCPYYITPRSRGFALHPSTSNSYLPFWCFRWK